eukprot:2517941-Rhodomonas_salina.2
MVLPGQGPRPSCISGSMSWACRSCPHVTRQRLRNQLQKNRRLRTAARLRISAGHWPVLRSRVCGMMVGAEIKLQDNAI